MRLALFALFACTITGNAADNPTADEREVIAAIVKLGGKGEVDAKLHVEARVVARFEAATDATLIALKKHPRIGAIEAFDVTRCTEKGFVALKDLLHLRKFVAGQGKLTVAAASALGQCKDLRHLVLVNTGLTDGELAGMKGLTRLEYLGISENAKVTDKGMATVKGFERLQVLHMNGASITDKGLAELKSLDGLRTLSVKGTKVTSDAAEKFADDMPNLRKVAW